MVSICSVQNQLRLRLCSDRFGEVSELAECAALEMRCTLLMCTVGSNPTLSARLDKSLIWGGVPA